MNLHNVPVVLASYVQAPPPPPVLITGVKAGPLADPEEENQEPPTSAERQYDLQSYMSAKPVHSKKNAWTPEEDAMLARIIAEQGHGHWTQVAAHLPGRMGRQCRERWFNHLAPEVKKGDWSKEEDELIVAAVREHGTKWSLIQKQLPGRSDNSIKNRCAEGAGDRRKSSALLCHAHAGRGDARLHPRPALPARQHPSRRSPPRALRLT